MEILQMKKYIYSTLFVVSFLATTSCSDYLETSSPSVVDANFVFSNIETARAAMDGAYEQWRDCAQNKIFGDGLFYGADATGSDIERHPEAFSNQPGRHYPECLYQNGTFASSYGLLSYQKEDDSYSSLYSAIGKANAVINAMSATDNFQAIMSAGSASDLSQLYGEAIALRACCYRELIRNFGDVPYQTKSGVAASGLASRDSIYDMCIGDLKTVEPLMYRVGETSSMLKNVFSRTFVQGLIGRMCLEAGGYQTRRTDLAADFYKDGEGNVLTFETKGSPNNNSVYERRSDWKDLYETAKTYLKACIDNPGSASFHTTDPRSTGKNGQVYDNPYQYFFQQMNDLEYADESIYEYAMTQGIGNDARTYSMGRVSSGGSSNGYPCKSYGQARINPAFYYGMFDPQDKRRDVSVCVTGSTGKGVEKLIPFAPNSKAEGGGLTLNKWDENRMASPYVAKQRTSGINGPYMRLSEIYLTYAEACAATGDDANAKTYLNKIRERSFPSDKANTDAFISSSGSILKAVINERGFEFAGEGDRRWTLIRSGLLPEAIKDVKDMTKAMLDGLKNNGYYTFPNGNTISSYIWTKLVDAKSQYSHRLTTECPADKEDDPVLSPGWRGQNDDWESFSVTAATAAKPYPIYGTATPKTNLAIKGLFEYIDPEGAEAAALVADGYTKVSWGAELVKYYDEYYTYLFYDYDYTKAPIYLWPFTPNILTTGGFTNGYGFKQK
ncbi:RagB/SusD family nutrient uptake outer membrane protein [Bacteroides ihuae]|uniref:RagB/SusD family nutrient uptake outer membrane protein n=1 Tax=Bacteroides ihuae TaxID=1852362 RepID=UPI00098E8958|nr:RagB/SusD family nutrient uptake outer membrane protein [Bacteroides ihuae]